jgi:hypothetical protein
MRPIAIGESDFKEIIVKQSLYVDKSLFIKALFLETSRVILSTRPRRFGKTLNLSMIRYFTDFNQSNEPNLFQNLKIWQNNDIVETYYHKYPVIFITLKDNKYNRWENAYSDLKTNISKIFLQWKPYREKLEPEEKEIYDRIVNMTASYNEFTNSFRTLTEWIYRWISQKVIILIDEYDTVFHSAYINGYFAEMMEFMRIFLGSSLKDNSNLEKALLTGIMKVAKESIFSGLNNLLSDSVVQPQFGEFFGITAPEIDTLLCEYQVVEQKELIKDWYDGYHFGKDIVYNPWSLSNFLKNKQFLPYWGNTSDNILIRDLITKSPGLIKQDLEKLIKGEPLKKRIEESIVFQDLTSQPAAFWSLFLASGYLKISGRIGHEYQITIPNKEIEIIFEQIIETWFNTGLNQSIQQILDWMLNGDLQNFKNSFQQLVIESFSYFDVGTHTAENFYHAFVLGLVINLKSKYV